VARHRIAEQHPGTAVHLKPAHGPRGLVGVEVGDEQLLPFPFRLGVHLAVRRHYHRPAVPVRLVWNIHQDMASCSDLQEGGCSWTPFRAAAPAENHLGNNL
jgi:hypothetical protein